VFRLGFGWWFWRAMDVSKVGAALHVGFAKTRDLETNDGFAWKKVPTRHQQQ
jgi:hypothetical protein